MKREAYCEGKEILDTRKICKVSCSNRFLNGLYLVALGNNGDHSFNFICDMDIQLITATNNIFYCNQRDYEKLLNDPLYSDFMLVTTTKKFHVHKNILAARSEVFIAMFENDMKEKKKGFAEIKEFSDEIVQEFLRYIYCGKVENLDKLAKDLLSAADKYLMADLKFVCLEEICKSITIKNAVELLSLVDDHDVECLRSNVIDYIVNNIKAIDKSYLETIQNVRLSNEILCRSINKYL